MELKEKLEILSASAKYDVSCSSSGSNRKNTSDGIGNAERCGICHSFTSDGRCVSLLKVLMTNMCIFDCKYCVNRRSNDVKRALFAPEEIASLTFNFYKRNYIEGLFLSSGIIKDPDYTMDKMIEAITILRTKYKFNGYIHAKAIPGASEYLIKKMGTLVDRMSTNIELPSRESLKLLAPDKKEEKIKNNLVCISENKGRNFARAGQTTQMIIGASPDTDYRILALSENMYHKYDLKRVYYSAYVPVNSDNLLPAVEKPPLLRENRLYQADWLLRFYGFKVSDLLDDEHPNFNTMLDPKADWALRHIENFPVEINSASYYTLLKVPGIGVTSAKRIMATRKFIKIKYDNLKKLGVVIKRAKYFITCNGEYYTNKDFFKKSIIETSIITEERKLLTLSFQEQLSLF